MTSPDADPRSSEDATVERPKATDRQCVICGATVAATRAMMACYCTERRWELVPAADPARKNLERGREALETTLGTLENGVIAAGKRARGLQKKALVDTIADALIVLRAALADLDGGAA